MFEPFNLKDDSFPITPGDQGNTPWFGFNALKREFETAFQRSASEALRLCVLNRGRFGAGKTHAARYFSEMQESSRNVGQDARFVPLIIESPKEPQNAFLDFAGRLFNAVTFRRIAQAAENLRATTSDEQLFSTLLKTTGSEDVATVLSKITEANLLSSKSFLLGGGRCGVARPRGREATNQWPRVCACSHRRAAPPRPWAVQRAGASQPSHPLVGRNGGPCVFPDPLLSAIHSGDEGSHRHNQPAPHPLVELHI